MATRSYAVTMDDRRFLTVRADNARTLDFHIEFYCVEDGEEIFVAMFSLSDVNNVIELDAVSEDSREGDDLQDEGE